MKRTSLSSLLAAAAAVFLLGATDASALSVPTPKTKSYTNTVKVTWKAVSGARQYIVFRATKKKWSKRVRIGTTTAKRFYDTSAKPGVNYFYWVCHVERNGRYYWYSKGRYKKGFRQVVAPYPTASYNSYSGYVRVTWSRTTGAKKFKVYRSTSTSASSAVLVGSTKYCSFNDTSATPGVKYYYWISAAGKNGVYCYDPAKRDYGMRKKVALAVPSPDGYFISDYSYRIYWSAVSGAVKYKVFVSSNPNRAFWNDQEYGWTDATSFTDTLNPGETWYYWICPVDRWGNWWYNSARCVRVYAP